MGEAYLIPSVLSGSSDIISSVIDAYKNSKGVQIYDGQSGDSLYSSSIYQVLTEPLVNGGYVETRISTNNGQNYTTDVVLLVPCMSLKGINGTSAYCSLSLDGTTIRGETAELSYSSVDIRSYITVYKV